MPARCLLLPVLLLLAATAVAQDLAPRPTVRLETLRTYGASLSEQVGAEQNPTSGTNATMRCGRTLPDDAPTGVRGLVSDSNGKTLPFASITLADGSVLVADSTGFFVLRGLKKETLVRVSHAGYRPVEIRVIPDTVLLVQLPSAGMLQEVVVRNDCAFRRTRCSTRCGSRIVRQSVSAAATAKIPVSPASIYPNPARAVLHLRGVASLRSLYLFDMSGRLLGQWREPFSGDTGSLYVDGYPAGTYLLRMQFADGRVQAERVVLLR